GIRWSCIVGDPLEGEVVSAGDSGVVEDDAAEDLGELAREKGDGVVGAGDVQAGAAGVDGGAVCLGRLEFWAALGDDQRIDGEFAGLLVCGKFATIGKQGLYHELLPAPGLGGRKRVQLGVDRRI